MLNQHDFAGIMAFLSSAIQKPITAETVKVYYALLGDFPVDVLQTAVKRVALEHKWASIPTAAEIREAAALTMRGKISELTPAEAWEMAHQAVAKIDLEIDGSAQRHTKNLPPIVVECLRAMGLPNLCHGKDPVSVLRSQFLKIFEQLAAREKRLSLYPAELKTAIESHGTQQIPPPEKQDILKIIDKIGRTI
ncbi:MAG: hypothetical protein KGJ13_07865 [Patescibacteria group bacterium]|nr:hypothetical protein [Patescibacteria group bacterium]